jgi:molecular chaperone DnaK (HSP70)
MIQYILNFIANLNPFNINILIKTILEESTTIQKNLNTMMENIEKMTAVIDNYESLLEKADQDYNKINNEKLVIVETIIIELDKVCEKCKDKYIDDTLKYLNEIKISILEDIQDGTHRLGIRE